MRRGYKKRSQQVAKGLCHRAGGCSLDDWVAGWVSGGAGSWPSKWGSRMTLFVQHFLRFTPFVPSGFINGQPQTASATVHPVHQPHQRKVNICIMCNCVWVCASLWVYICVCMCNLWVAMGDSSTWHVYFTKCNNSSNRRGTAGDKIWMGGECVDGRNKSADAAKQNSIWLPTQTHTHVHTK